MVPPWTVTMTVRNYPPGARVRLVLAAPDGSKRAAYDLAVSGPDPWSTGISVAGMPPGTVATLTVVDAYGVTVTTSTATLP
jgi:hypothetical protein